MPFSTRNKQQKLKRARNKFRAIAVLLPTMMICSLPAYAQYTYQVVIPPGAVLAQTFGINNAGIVTGGADDGVAPFTFVYDMKTGTYTTISEEFSALEINNSGVMVGDVDGVCAIRNKNGSITTFSPPSIILPDDSFCQARGINSNGKVSGFEIDEFGVWMGFIYDSQHGTYEEFLPSAQTFAHAINSQGQTAGSERLAANDAYPGSAEGRYGYLREKNGSVKYFEISQSIPGQSRGRGISESGLVTGFYIDPVSSEFKSFVTTLSKGDGFETITLDDDQVIHQKPCDPNVPPPPGPEEDWVLYTDMTASQIRNDGVVVGSCFDYYINETTGDFVEYGYGFIATPE